MEITLLEKGFHKAHENFPEGGTCLEFGVSIGNTYIWQAQQILEKYRTSKLIGFDSWKGLPEETKNVWAPSRHKQGAFASPRGVVEARLKVLTGTSKLTDERFRLVDGFFHDSLTPELLKTINNLIFVNIDVDIHKSTIELLNFIKPLLRPKVILYWDDWKDPQDLYNGQWGEHLAWYEWSIQNPTIKAETLEINQWNQRIMEIV